VITNCVSFKLDRIDKARKQDKPIRSAQLQWAGRSIRWNWQTE